MKLLTDRLKAARKGIILLHDPKAQTAAMLPAFLRYLRDNNYRVVHVVPAGRQGGFATNPIEPADWIGIQTIKGPFIAPSVMIGCQVTLPRSATISFEKIPQ